MNLAIEIKKDVADTLEDDGLNLQAINHIIFSHHHWDHTGDTTKIPSSTSLINVDVRSVFKPVRATVPYFEDNDNAGCFIQIASASALRPRPEMTWYGASRAAINTATKALAVEYASKNLRFNSISPTLSLTSMTHNLFKNQDGKNHMPPHYLLAACAVRKTWPTLAAS
ncbi:hypothetical protein BDV12DRAFT_202298 [Aspergillus spectabilis]